MAFKKETITKIAALLKLKAEDIETAIKDENEVDLAIPEDIQVFTTTELESRDTNQKNEGIKTGKDLAIKDLKKEAGLDFEGKDAKKLIEEINKKAIADANLKPDEKVKTLNDQVALLQKQVGEKDTEIGTLKSQVSGVSLDRQLLAKFPKNRLETLSDDEYLTLLKSNLQFEDIDGAMVVKKGGELLRDDKTKNPLPVDDAIGNFFKDRKWTSEGQPKTPAGRGGGNSNQGGSAAMKWSEAKENWEKDNPGKSVNSAAFQTYINDLAKENADFEFDQV